MTENTEATRLELHATDGIMIDGDVMILCDDADVAMICRALVAYDACKDQKESDLFDALYWRFYNFQLDRRAERDNYDRLPSIPPAVADVHETTCARVLRASGRETICRRPYEHEGRHMDGYGVAW